jgi:AraC-like DNA-binding protein
MVYAENVMQSRQNPSTIERKRANGPCDRRVPDSRLQAKDSALLGPLKQKLTTQVGYSSASAKWSGEIIAERWRLPATEYPEVVLKRHRLAVFLGSSAVPTWASVDGSAMECAVQPGHIRVIPQEVSAISRLHSPLDLAVFEFSAGLMERLLDGRVMAPSEQLVPHTCVPDPVAYCIARNIVTELTAPTERLYGEMLCLTLAVHLLQRYGRTRVHAAKFEGRLSSTQARRVLDYMHANLDGRLSISMLAGEAGLSDAYFSRAFRATFSQPPHRVILQWRLERALRLIQAKGVSLADAAIGAGFYDQAHFTNAMRKDFGLAPTELMKVSLDLRGLPSMPLAELRALPGARS